MRRLALAVLVLLVLAAGAACAQTVLVNEDFVSNTEGWVLSGNSAFVENGTGFHSQAMGANALYAPDGSDITIDLAGLASAAERSRLLVEFDAWGTAYDINQLRGSGAELYTDGGSRVRVAGFDGTMGARYTMGSNIWTKGYWTLDYGIPGEPSNKWLHYTIDYGFSDPTRLKVYVPDAAGYTSGVPGAQILLLNEALANEAVTSVLIGGINSTNGLQSGWPWAQAWYDNVKITAAAVPEPSSMLALASGLFGMAGFAIRRRK